MKQHGVSPTNRGHGNKREAVERAIGEATEETEAAHRKWEEIETDILSDD